MSNKTIGGASTSTSTPLPVASTIDGTNDYLAIYTANVTATQAISRATLLGVTGQPADISSVQTLTNKIIGPTNTLTALDSTFLIQDNIDTTKKVAFQASGLTTGVTRTFTFPDVSGTIVTKTSVDTLTNKTLTSPTINGGTLDNATVTVDAVAGHTVAGTGTVYGLAIAGGAITTAGYASSTALQTNAVQGNQIATNAITLGYAASTTTFSTSSTTAVQVTGLTATVTIPAGNRKVKITAFCGSMFSSTGPSRLHLEIWDGVVGAGTKLAMSAPATSAAANPLPGIAIAVVTPAAGSKTYNIGALTETGANACSLEASATEPMFILVEAI